MIQVFFNHELELYQRIVIFKSMVERVLLSETTKELFVSNAEIVRHFEEEFKNANNFAIVDQLMADDFEHHLPYPGVPRGREGMRAIGDMVTGAFRDISVSVDLLVAEGDLVADRISARGVRNDNNEAAEWVENHIYRLVDGRIVELWPAGGPALS